MKFLFIFALALSCLAHRPAVAAPLQVVARNESRAFPIVANQRATPIVVAERDAKVAHIAADALASDIDLVAGVKPNVSANVPNGDAVIFVGTLGHSPTIDALVASGKLNVAAIRGQWESFQITTIDNPTPKVKRGLFLVGSDRRGTAYAAYALSEAMGVSPWNWWADVMPNRQSELWLRDGVYRQGSPSVKYRGIFINDENWGFRQWAFQTFEPESKVIGPVTYARVFELLLRLKANYLWPAMHKGSGAFNSDLRNREVADDYAIVMGSSHAERMLRNNVVEWDGDEKSWNYDTNRDKIANYWETRVRENGRFENVYTLGMRGVHDTAMNGGGTDEEKVARLQRVLRDQREILANNINPNVEKVPQILVNYKEVLDLYREGLEMPDDVTLVCPTITTAPFANSRRPTNNGARAVRAFIIIFRIWGNRRIICG